MRGFFINAEPGGFTVTGFVADLVYTPIVGFELDCQPGTFSITGADAALLVERLLNAEPGAFSLTGLAAGVLAGRALNAEPGVFVLTGSQAGLLADRILSANPGAFTLTGVDATLSTLQQFELNCAPGSFNVVGSPAWGNWNFETFPSAGGQRIRIDLATGQLVLIVNAKTVMTL